MSVNLERVSPEEVGFSSDVIQRWLNALEKTGTEMHSFMLARHGKVCAEGWWQPYAPPLIHSQQSLTKTYTVTALGALHDEGLLSLEEKVADLFEDCLPANPCERLKRMTVWHLLSMSSGIRGSVDIGNPHWIRDFLSLPVSEEPGKAFQYSGLCTALGAAILRRKTGMNLIEYMCPRIFDKIGIDASKLKSLHMGDGLEYAGGGFFTTTEDNLRLMMLYLNQGVWQGNQVLSREWCQAVTTRQIDTASEERNNPGSTDNYVGYGLQCWMCRPKGVYRADGAMGQYAIVFPELDAVLAITETADIHKGQHQAVLNTIWDVLMPGIQAGEPVERTRAYEALQRRIQCLALQRKVYDPCLQTDAKRIHGKTWFLEKNDVVLLPGTCFASIGREKAGVEALTFRFYAKTAELLWKQHGETMRVEVGTYGIPVVNQGCYGPARLEWLWALGGWKKPNVFECELRMLETCFSVVYIFCFEDTHMSMQIRARGAQPGKVQTSDLVYGTVSDKGQSFCP